MDNVIGFERRFFDFCIALHCEAMRLEAEGSFAEEWETLLAGLRGSRHVGQYGDIFARLHGTDSHGFMTRDVGRWSAHSQVTAGQLQNSLKEVREAFALTAPPSRTLQREYLCAQAVLADPYRSRTFEFYLPQWQRSLGAVGEYIAAEPTISQRVFQHQFANILLHADRPFAERPPVRGEIPLYDEKSTAARESTSDTFARLGLHQTRAKSFASSLKFSVTCDEERARQAALELTLALQWHFRLHQKFPAALSDLSFQKLLPTIPDDPFAPVGTKMHYRLEGAEARLWSIGPDGRDDNGRRKEKDSPSDDLSFQVSAPHA